MSGAPRMRVGHLDDVDLAALRGRGVRALLLDLDNTLCDPRADDVSAEARVFCARMRELGLRGYVLSNGRSGRAERLAGQLGLPCISQARKPLRGAYLRALSEMNLPPHAVAAVGDQFLTDAIGAMRMGLALVLVEPRWRRDKPLVRMARPLDRILRRLVPEGGGE